MPHHIALLDSGVGGLTIFEHVVKDSPNANFTYICDTAAYPYGKLPEDRLKSRVDKVVTQLHRELPFDLLVVACNTASTIVLAELRGKIPQPVVGVVPAVKPAAEQSPEGVITVLATPGTVERQYLQTLVADFAQGKTVHLVAAPELVQWAEDKARGLPWPVAEFEQWVATKVTPLQADTVVLGCTHFPLLRAELQSVLGAHVTLLDSGAAIGRRVNSLLAELPPKTGSSQSPLRRYLSTGTHIPKDLQQLYLEPLGFNSLELWSV